MASFIISAFADEAAPDLAGQIAVLKRNGIAHIDLRNIDGGCIIDYGENELAAVKKQLDGAGIEVSAIGSPIGKAPVGVPIEQEIAGLNKAVRAARVLNAGYIRLFSFYPPEGEADKSENAVVEKLERLCEVAQAANVDICLENELALYGDVLPRMRRLLEHFSGRIGHVFDSANYILSGDDAVLNAKELLPYITHVHVKDALRDTGQIVACGEGDGGYAGLIQALKARDTVVRLTLEPHLFDFAGLGGLAHGTLVRAHAFQTPAEAFDYAARAMKQNLHLQETKKCY